MRRLSIVIPHAGNNERLETTLLSVLENRPEACEILVVLSSVYNDPYGLAAENEVSFLYAPIGTDTVRCLNLGADASQAPVVHFLNPGMVVAPGWSEAALARLDRDPTVATISPIVYDLNDTKTVLSRGIDYRTGGAVLNVTRENASPLGPSRYAGFYRKSLFNKLDQFDVELGKAAADMDLALKIHVLGGKTAVEPMCRVFYDQSMERRPIGLTAARATEQLFWRWASKKGWIRSLASHLGQAVFDTCAQLLRPSILSSTLGRLIGLASVGNHRQLNEQLETAKRHLSVGTPDSYERKAA